MNSIRIKMVIMYLTLVFIVMIACGTFTVVSLRVNENKKSERTLTDAAEMIKEMIVDAYAEEAFQQELWSLTRPEAGANRIEYNILSKGGHVLATSVTDNPALVGDYSSSAIITAMAGASEFVTGRKYPNFEGRPKQWMEFARPVLADGATVYIIYLRMDATETYESIGQIINVLVLGLLIALAVAAVLGVFFAESVNKPIAMLTRKAKDFARGELDHDIKVMSKDEIGQLTDTLNHMAYELSKNIEGIENEKNKTEIVLHNVTDGVIAYEMSGKLAHSNHVCKELLGVRDITALSLDDMLVRLKLKDSEGGGTKEVKDHVLEINGRFINVSCNHYKGIKGEADGVIILLQDLTKHIMLDNMRKEFVANVSHELRTPLTTIKSYAETLVEEMTEEAGGDGHCLDFLQTIDGEADRMTVLVNDLLELSRLDNKQMDFNVRTASLTELVRQNISRHQHSLLIKGSGKVLRFTTPESEMLVNADHERVSQVLNNIITNSLRYSGDDAIVDVEMDECGDFYYIRIKDNGVGIPDEDQNRIFERFYRVDKARSRELGGTGLGLSISKEIIEAHGGSITVESRLGVGTTMVIGLKKHTPIPEGEQS